MARQQPLFTDEESPPTFEPLHPKFVGRGKVRGTNKFGDTVVHTVDLGKGSCDCPKGYSFVWSPHKGRWMVHQYCMHKIRALSEILRKHPNDDDMRWAYIKAVATRYNSFETVSAFHKELRRGDVERAVFFASVLSAYRGLAGIVRYLRNIVYEETRDHALALYLLKLGNGIPVTFANVCKAIRWFCETKKKWELPHRHDILMAEMKAYKHLVEKYPNDSVAFSCSRASIDDRDWLLETMTDGWKHEVHKLWQIAVKGLQKSDGDEFNNRNDLIDRIWLYSEQKEPRHSDIVVPFVDGYLSYKHQLGEDWTYHDANAFADLAFGEPFDAGILPKKRQEAILAGKTPEFPLGKTFLVPKYAHDNHTYLGKALLKRHPGEVRPGADQKNLDLRWCGAYMGVCWRQLAKHQFPKRDITDIKWGEVKWPSWLWQTVMKLWY